jgi:lipid-A-disaccharide synthase
LVALLPGSRRQEITRMLPLMAKAAQAFPDHRFVVAAAPSVPDALYDEVLGASGLEVVRGVTYDVLRQARAALVTSGTATLETALFGVPQVVCYKGGTLNVWLARRLVKVPFISLVNLVMGREVVRELVQDDLSEAALVAELGELLREGPKRHQQMADLVLLKGMLGGPGASRKVAFAVWKSLGTAT